jgi:hypothetical protein
MRTLPPIIFIGLENINPVSLMGREETTEQDLGISRDATGLATAPPSLQGFWLRLSARAATNSSGRFAAKR